MAAKKQMSFEQAMDRLEEIVKKLESGDGSLDQALTLFEEGSKLAGCLYSHAGSGGAEGDQASLIRKQRGSAL